MMTGILSAFLQWVSPMVLVHLLVGSALCCIIGMVYFSVCKRRWGQALRKFSKLHHKTRVGDQNSKDKVLLIVSPASGGGAAMRMFPECMHAFRERNAHVEVYVTNASKDVMGLVQKNDLRPYNCIAVLAGDSTITELMQSSLVQNESWPYAPILHLPGGTANVLAAEIAPSATCRNIIGGYSKSRIRRASVIKASAIGTSSSTPKYSLHVWGAGVQGFVTDSLERSRAGFYAAFGKIGIDIKIAETLLFVPQTFLLCVFNSDYEAKGSNLGFGVSSFDDQMSMVHIPNIRFGLVEVLPIILKMSLGIMANEYRSNSLPQETDVRVVRNQPLQVRRLDPFKLHADGTSNVTVDCNDGTAIFEVIKDAVPFYC